MQSVEEAHGTFRFYVTIHDVAQAVFTEVTGLQVETVVMDYEEGGNNAFVHKLPGRTKVGNLTLKHGMTRTNELFTWFAKVVGGEVDRRNVSVIMFDSLGEELVRWDFLNAYPVKWVGPQLGAASNAVAIETLELAHEGLRLT
jgi:phage tail-like protein